jgi:hypothetical protein
LEEWLAEVRDAEWEWSEVDEGSVCYDMALSGLFAAEPSGDGQVLRLAARALAGHSEQALREEAARQAGLARDVLGNPFRPVAFDPAWRSPTVVALAEAAYQERLLPSGELDPQRLAVLADALEEADADAVLLAHLRGPGPHVRGCFAIDAVLGRE